MKAIAITIIATLGALVLGVYAFVQSGAYDVGADRPHTAGIQHLLEMVRTRSIAKRAAAVTVPNLDDPARLAEGAEHYSAMCTSCHLAPGLRNTELRQGLLPQPPDLSRNEIGAAEAFWVIKHGIKATAMPAWGQSHDDEAIWNLVAFVLQLPKMTPEQYRAATMPRDGEASSPAHGEHDVEGAHQHTHFHDEHEHKGHEHAD